jgi:NAD(P)H-dependent flavin oxidoreductase YrpB (nitropropane dioxygenase family)
MIVDSAKPSDIVYSNYFTGIPGNYLKPSITASGLDPDDLPEADPTKMNFDKSTSGRQGLEGNLGLRSGHRRGQEDRPGVRTRRPAGNRVQGRPHAPGAVNPGVPPADPEPGCYPQ